MELTKINFPDLKVGDILEDFCYGKSIVVDINNTAFPIHCTNDVHTGVARYTYNGCLDVGEKRPSLYLKIEEL